jgi:hypothetical protein
MDAQRFLLYQRFYKGISSIRLQMHMVSNKTSRVKITLTLPADLAKWVDERVEAREYATRSHALEVALLELKKDKSKSDNLHNSTGGK